LVIALGALAGAASGPSVNVGAWAREITGENVMIRASVTIAADARYLEIERSGMAAIVAGDPVSNIVNMLV